MADNIDQIIKDTWTKEIHCIFFTMGTKLFSICLKTDVVLLLREVKHLLPIVLCKESPYHLINALRPFPVILQPFDFYKVKFTDTSSAGKTARKMTQYFNLSAST